MNRRSPSGERASAPVPSSQAADAGPAPPQPPAPLPVFRCGCGYGTLLDRPYCPKCRDPLIEGFTDPHGVVLSWTILAVAPGSTTPAVGLAMVGLSSGINAMTRFTADDPLAIGDDVIVEFRADGLRWSTRDVLRRPAPEQPSSGRPDSRSSANRQARDDRR